MSKLIVLLSGGLDSAVGLASVRDDYAEISALTFDYNQKSAAKEKIAAKKISKYYNLNHQTIKLEWLSQISRSSLNTDKEVPVVETSKLDDKRITQKSAKSVWVPNRNGLFVNIAACFADAYGYDAILIGANKEEGATFKDNTPKFINAMNSALKNSVDKKVKLIAPFIDFSKEDIIKEGIRLNVPFEFIHSCYVSNEKHCGICESCRRLKRALELNNRHDIIMKIFDQRF